MYVRIPMVHIEGTEPVIHEAPDLRYSKYAHLYTKNELTLCQAATGIIAAHSMEHSSYISLKDLFSILSTDDTCAIAHGFEGSINAWWDAGHRPTGWYQLFRDNYKQYREPLCTQQTIEPEDQQ